MQREQFTCRKSAFLFPLICCFLATLTTATASEFIPLGDLPGGDFYSAALGVSADGTAVVGFSKTNNTFEPLRAFRWTQATGMLGLGDEESTGEDSIARTASADGTIIVGQNADGAFQWTEATGMVSLNDGSNPDVSTIAALGVSADGTVITGTARNAIGQLTGFRWTAATGPIDIGHLPSTTADSFASGVSADGAVLTGQSMRGDNFEVVPIRWTEQTGMVDLGDVPGGLVYALGLAISADGSTIVGDAIGPLGDFEAFRWTQQTGAVQLDPAMSTLFEGSAGDASVDGSVIVGSGGTPEGGAMIWDEQNLMRHLPTILTNDFGLDLTGWTLLSANGISDNARTIVGSGWNPSGDLEAWLVRLTPPTVAGDMNGDGSVTLLDIPDFVAVLLGEDRDFVHLIIADMNADGRTDGRDTVHFTDAITSP